MTANEAWWKLLHDLQGGTDAKPRGLATSERIMRVSHVDMCCPLVTVRARKIGYRFAAAEAMWILQGSNRLDGLQPWAPSYAKFSDDGRTLNGAYGPSVVTQIPYVVDVLQHDPESRQAIIGIWRPSPRSSRDIPCTMSVQFLLREGHIHTNVFMRSSDAWIGWPYDVFSFTMVTIHVALLFNYPPNLGTLTLIAGSQHLYESNQAAARACLSLSQSDEYRPISTYDLLSPDHLMNCLGSVRDGRDDVRLSPFFRCMQDLAHETTKA